MTMSGDTTKDVDSDEYVQQILTLTNGTENAFESPQGTSASSEENHKLKPLQDLSEDEMIKMALEQSLRETPENNQQRHFESMGKQVNDKSDSFLNRAGQKMLSSSRVGAFPVGGTGRNDGDLEDLTVSAIVVDNPRQDLETGNIPVAYTVNAELAPSENPNKVATDTDGADVEDSRPEKAPQKAKCASTRNLYILLVVVLLLAVGGVVGAILAMRSNGSSSSSSSSTTSKTTNTNDDDNKKNNPLCADDPRCNNNPALGPGPDLDSPECDLDPICADAKAKGVPGH